MKINQLLILLVMFWGMPIMAQTQTIKGKVVQPNYQPIPNATIQLLGNKNTTFTNENGSFIINANIKDEVIITHINYKTVKTKLTENITIVMQPSTIALNEILLEGQNHTRVSQTLILNNVEKKLSQPRNVSDLFIDQQGFGVAKRGAYATEPVFRAFKYEQLNVQFDGGMKVLNACPNRMDPITTHIIPEEIEKVEVIKGPFTVRYGPSFGAIINFVSKQPSEFNVGLSGSLESGFESNGNNLVSNLSLQYISEKYSVLLNTAYREFGNYEDGNGTKVPSSFRSTDYSVKVGYNPSNNHKLQLIWRQSFANDINHAGLPMDSPYDKSLLGGINYTYSFGSNNTNHLNFKAYYSYVDHLMTNENRINYKMVDAQSPVEVSTYGAKTELVFQPIKKLTIFSGFDANLIEREGNRTRLVKIINGTMLPEPKAFIDKIWQDATIHNIGVFTEANFNLSNRLTLISGIRTDFLEAKIDDPSADFEALYGNIDTENDVNLSFNSSLKYRNNGFKSQLSIGRGVRSASMIERYINHFSVGVDPYEYVGNPNLKPEKNTQLEFSASKHFSTITIGLSGFYSFLDNYIVPVVNPNISRKFMPTIPPTVAKQFINIDKAYQTGVEFLLDYSPTEYLFFNSSFSYTYGKNRALDEPLPQIPPFKALLSAKFEKKKYWFSIQSRLVAAQNRVAHSFLETKSKGYGVMDIRMGYNPFNKLSIGTSVQNLFNKNYYNHLNFSYKNSSILMGKIYEPGRSFTAYVKYSF